MGNYMIFGCISFDDGSAPLLPDLQITVNDNFTGFKLTGPNDYVIDWGDGSPLETITAGTDVFCGHTFGGNSTIKVYSAGITEFEITNNDGMSSSCTSLDIMPNSLLSLICSSQLISTFSFPNLINLTSLDLSLNDSLTTIDCAALGNVIRFSCANCTSLTLLDIVDLTSCTNFNCSECTSLTNLGCSALSVCTSFNASNCSSLSLLVDVNQFNNLLNCFVHNCSLTTTNINDFLIALDGFGLTGGVFDTSGQTPPAPPSGAGATAAADLVGTYLWTVTTD